jgi:hypothetical protein
MPDAVAGGIPPVDGRRVVVWAVLCAIGWLVSGLVAYGLGQGIASAITLSRGDSEFEPHRWAMTTWVAAWALIGPAAVLAVSRMTFGLRPKAMRRALPWALAGATIAAWLELALLGWGFDNYGPQGADPDLLGSVAFLAMAVVIVPTVVAAHRTTPLRYVFWGVLATALAALPAVGIVALNVETFAGQDPDRLAVLAPLMSAGFYAWAAVIFSIKFLQRSQDGAPPAT